jgi:murein L,D-transpeptidase YcbB/YkuD
MLAWRPRTSHIIGAGAAIVALFAIGLAIGYEGPRLLAPTTASVAPRPAKAIVQPPPSWSPATLRQLLATVDSARDEGLRPSDYRRDELARIVTRGAHGAEIDPVAEAIARSLAHDYADGRVKRRKRVDWHIVQAPDRLAAVDGGLDIAVRGERVDSYLHALLPQDPRYRALREALRDTGDGDAVRMASIRASMERWRWMPRTLGQDYVFVNVPSYRVALFEGDKVVALHDVVVGAPKTPTPMLSANVGSIIVNPWWTLPPTVLKEGKRYSPAKGYVYQTIGGKTYVRQKPGPMNALGRVKIDMPNPYAIYLHDTPAKWAFAKTDRALSHGCIRVKDIATLAEKISDTVKVDAALGTNVMHSIGVHRTLPVYIVYFTAAPDGNGAVQLLPDPYARDAGVIAALDGKPTAPVVVRTTAPGV